MAGGNTFAFGVHRFAVAAAGVKRVAAIGKIDPHHPNAIVKAGVYRCRDDQNESGKLQLGKSSKKASMSFSGRV